VAQITGRGDAFVALTNTDLGLEEIEAKMREQIVRHNLRVIFTDLHGGSATLAARRIAHEIHGLSIVTGANLAALIDFVFADVATSSGDAARHAVEKGRTSLTATES